MVAAVIGGGMTRHQRRFDDSADWSAARRRSGSSASSLILATALGVGIGLLAAPQPGVKTRKRLRKQLAAISAELGEGLGEAQELSGKAREGVRDRLARLRKRGTEAYEDLEERLTALRNEDEEEDESSTFGTLFALAAGIAATYFLTSERAGPARTKVRETAETVRREAADRWDRFQHRVGPNGQSRTSDEAQAESAASDEGRE
jgi:gas vesicle protein